MQTQVGSGPQGHCPKDEQSRSSNWVAKILNVNNVLRSSPQNYVKHNNAICTEKIAIIRNWKRTIVGSAVFVKFLTISA